MGAAVINGALGGLWAAMLPGRRVGMPPPVGYRAVLAKRDLRLLFGGLVISFTGSWAYSVALLAFVFERTHSPGWVGAAGLGRFVPALLFSAYGGVLADRFERVRLMVTSDLLCLGWQTGLAVVASLDGPVPVAIALAALTSVSNVVYQPAVAATLPEVAGEELLVAANAINGTVENLVIVLGPAIGAGLLALGSPALTFAFDAGTYAISAALVGRMRARSKPVDVTEGGIAGPFEQMAIGVRAIAGSGAARLLVGLSMLASFIYGTDTVLMVQVSQYRLGSGAGGLGYLLAGEGFGGILIAGIVNRLAGSVRLAAIISAGLAAYCLPIALLAVVHSPALAFALSVLRGAGTLVVDVLAITALQRSVAQELMARVFGVFFALVLAAISLGALLAPILVDQAGLNAALITIAVAPLALGLLAYPGLMRLDRAASANVIRLRPRINVLERLGIFADASQPVLERLAAACHDLDVTAGTTIIRQGQAADALYILIDGRIQVSFLAASPARPKILGTMVSGSYFGEIGLLERIPRTATCTATTPCQLYKIDGDAFLEALSSAPPSAALLEDARVRLARTRPSQRTTH